MYDLINGDQVKLFTVPFLMETTDGYEIQESLGSLIHFSNGDAVPYETLYYCYTEDFIIFNYMDEKSLIHIIKDGKLFGSISLDDMSGFKFSDKTKVFSTYGTRLNVSSYEEMINLLDDFNAYDVIASNIRRNNLSELREIAKIEDKEEVKARIASFQQKNSTIEAESAYDKYLRKWIIPDEDSRIKKFGMLKHLFLYSEDGNIKNYCLDSIKQMIKADPDFLK